MKLEELRIGNLIWDKRTDTKYALTYEQYVELINNPIIIVEHIFGVPITDELLLSGGFTIVHVPSAYGYDCNKYCEDKRYILRGAWNKKSWFALEILNNGCHKEIGYAHRLQNLYFELTENELIFKIA